MSRKTFEWNESLKGDFLWSNVNIGEAMPDVMTPFTWSLTQATFDAMSLLPGYHLIRKIGGRPYNNISVTYAVLRATSRTPDDLTRELGSTSAERQPALTADHTRKA